MNNAGDVLSPEAYRLKKFHKILDTTDVDLVALRKLSWTGVPRSLRGDVWKLLLGYIPTRRSSQAACLARKRREYRDLIPRYFDQEDYYDNHDNSDDDHQNNTVEQSGGADCNELDKPLPPSFISRSTEEQKVLRQVCDLFPNVANQNGD